MKAALLLSLAFVIAGCADSKPSGQPGTGTETGVPTGGGDPGNFTGSVVEPGTWDGSMSLDQCTGWEAFWADLPASLVPAPNTPPGWEQNDPTAQAGAAVLVFQCQKIGLGPLQRGPVNLMIDWHYNADIPEKCVNHDGFASEGVLGRLYVDDPEVAAFLNKSVGMPTGLLQIRYTEEILGPLVLHKVHWSADGGEESFVQMVRDESSTTRANVYQLYWPANDNLVRWKFNPDREEPRYTDRKGNGTFQQPMLMASINENYVGTADWFTETSGPTYFTVFDDFGCEEPFR